MSSVAISAYDEGVILHTRYKDGLSELHFPIAGERGAKMNTFGTPEILHFEDDQSTLSRYERYEDASCKHPCKHHPASEKYPNGLNAEHISSLEKFVDDLNTGLRNTFPRSTAPYKRSHVLLISWEEDDLGTVSEIDELGALFRDQYRFTTEHFKIPTEDAEDQLEEKLVIARNQHAKESDLLIIYYGGHGILDEQGRSIWKAWERKEGKSTYTSPRADWSTLEPSLDKAKGDVALILDCCHAVANVKLKPVGMKELLAASGKNGKATAVHHNSFTNALIRELKAIRGQPCSISTLHGLLYEHQMKYDLKLSPIRADLSGSPDATSIQLMALEKVKGRDSLSSSIDIARSLSTTSERTSITLVGNSMTTDCRILISVHLEDPDQIPLVQEWTKWFKKHAPQNIASVEFELENFVRLESAYESNSKLLIVSMPLALWNVMPPNPAYSFIAAIRSQNLLVDGATRSEAVMESTKTPPGKSREFRYVLKYVGCRPY